MTAGGATAGRGRANCAENWNGRGKRGVQTGEASSGGGYRPLRTPPKGKGVKTQGVRKRVLARRKPT